MGLFGKKGKLSGVYDEQARECCLDDIYATSIEVVDVSGTPTLVLTRNDGEEISTPLPGGVDNYATGLSLVGTVLTLTRTSPLPDLNVDLAPLLSSSISIGNTLFVSTLGDDGTGIRERLDLHYATPWAAVNAAQSGDEVIVHRGVYVHDDTHPSNAKLVKDGVTVRFEEGARVVQTATSLANLFFDEGQPVTATVIGLDYENQRAVNQDIYFATHPLSNYTLRFNEFLSFARARNGNLTSMDCEIKHRRYSGQPMLWRPLASQSDVFYRWVVHKCTQENAVAGWHGPELQPQGATISNANVEVKYLNWVATRHVQFLFPTRRFSGCTFDYVVDYEDDNTIAGVNTVGFHIGLLKDIVLRAKIRYKNTRTSFISCFGGAPVTGRCVIAIEGNSNDTIISPHVHLGGARGLFEVALDVEKDSPSAPRALLFLQGAEPSAYVSGRVVSRDNQPILWVNNTSGVTTHGSFRNLRLQTNGVPLTNNNPGGVIVVVQVKDTHSNASPLVNTIQQNGEVITTYPSFNA